METLDPSAMAIPTSNIPQQAQHDSAPNPESAMAFDPQVVQENVKNIKRKVISVGKLMEIFGNKETETANLTNELNESRQRIAQLEEQLKKGAPSAAQDSQLKARAEALAKEAEHARAEAEEAKAKLVTAENSLKRQITLNKSAEMLKTQLEARLAGQDKFQDQVNELNKKLIAAQKEAEQAGRRGKQEVSDLREKLMKAKANNSGRAAWLEQQKKTWEQDEEERYKSRTKELQDKLDELEHQLEDANTERYLEMELAKEEQKNTEEKLKTASQMLEVANNTIKSLNDSVTELRIKNDVLEHKLSAGTSHSTNMEIFEEFDPEKTLDAPSRPVHPQRTHTPPAKQSDSDIELTGDRLDRALSSIEGLKDLLHLHRLVSGSTNDKKRIAALSEQIKTLTKEKEALQNELTRRLVEKPTLIQVQQPADAITTEFDPWNSMHDDYAPITPTAASASSVKKQPQLKRNTQKQKMQDHLTQANAMATSAPVNVPKTTALTNTPATSSRASTLTISAPTAADTVVNVDGPKKRGRKRKVDLELQQTDPTPTKKPCTPKSPTTVRKLRVTKKTTKASTIDLSRIEIRNISLNPIIPSISNPVQYFTCMMSSALANDKQASIKLDTVATVLPTRMCDLFEAVQMEAREIAPKVPAFRNQRNILEDDTETWALPGYASIAISKSLCPGERFMVQTLCVLHERFPEMNIIGRLFEVLHEKILKDAFFGGDLRITSVLIRVLTGVYRCQDDAQRPRVLAYDLLREISNAKSSLILCEAITSVWPAVFAVDSEMKPEDSGLFLAKCIQAILSTHQEATRTEQIPFGFATFTQKCGWPSLESAPYVDEVVKELMDAVRAPNFAELCRTKPGYEFSLRKGLELLFVQGYGWSEFYNEFLRTDLFKMMIDGERYRIALPLVAAVARETRFDSADAAAVNTTSIQKFLEAILDSDAKTDHQAEAALAVVVMSNGRASRLTKVREWVGALGDEVRPKLPSLLQRALF